MIIDRRKLALATLVSALLLGLLVHLGRWQLPDLSRAEPAWLAAVAAAHLIMVAGRGFSLRALAPDDKRGPIVRWVQLAARHQLLFSIVPGGFGDAGFPYLAQRLGLVDAPTAVRIIAQFRLRDMIILGIMALLGLILLGLPGKYAPLALALVLPLLWFSDDLAVVLLKIARSLVPRGRILEFIRQSTDHQSPSVRQRAVRTALACLVWSSSVIAVIAAFRAIGVDLPVAQALLFVAAVNVAGALSISIAGLGVSEAGAAAALVAAGSPLRVATSLALVVRPTLLVSIVLMSLLIEGVTRTIRSGSKLRAASTP